jgi:transcriptional regulator with XRE-family HTH domain
MPGRERGDRVAESITTVRSRRLGLELKELRERRGVKPEQVAERLGCARSKISRYENGKSGVRKPELEILLDFFDVRDQRLREALFALARTRRTRGWWQDYEGSLGHEFLELIKTEAEADNLRSFENHTFPGLCQSKSYAEALIRGAGLVRSPEDVDRFVDIRLQRQKMLQAPDSPQFVALVHESALHLRVGGAEVMRDQLRHLAEVNNPPHFSIQVIPNEHGAHPGIDGSFMIVTFADPTNLDVVVLDHMRGTQYVEADDDVARYLFAFDHLRSIALSVPQTNKLLLRQAQEYEHQ